MWGRSRGKSVFSIGGKCGGTGGGGEERVGDVMWNGGGCYWLGSERPRTQLRIPGQACERRLYHTCTNGCNSSRNASEDAGVVCIAIVTSHR